jgi:hypothetical protein
MLSSDDDQVIVVRFWPEDDTSERQPSRHWRARIIHVNTGEQHYAPSIDDAFAIMSSLILTGEYQS